MNQGGWVQIVMVRINPVRVEGSDCNSGWMGSDCNHCRNKPSQGGRVQIVMVRINPVRVEEFRLYW